MSDQAFKKFDSGKLRWHLMPEDVLEEVLKVLEFGAQKYGDFNWVDAHKDVRWTRYMNAKERHFKAWKKGQDRDTETGLYELAHDIANSIFLLKYQIDNLGQDDRRKLKQVRLQPKATESGYETFLDEDLTLTKTESK